MRFFMQALCFLFRKKIKPLRNSGATAILPNTYKPISPLHLEHGLAMCAPDYRAPSAPQVFVIDSPLTKSTG